MKGGFRDEIKTLYPFSNFYKRNGKVIVSTEDGINFSYIFDGSFYNIDFIYVFDEAKESGKLKRFLGFLEKCNSDVKILEVVSEILNKELKKRGYLNVPGNILEIEIPKESFCLNKKSGISLSEDEEEIIDCGEEEFLLDNDGAFGDYVIIKRD